MMCSGHSFEVPVYNHVALFCTSGQAEHHDREGTTSTKLLPSGNHGETLAGPGPGPGIDSTLTHMLPRTELFSLG